MSNRSIIAAIGVCHRDVELACLWLRWVAHLAQHARLGNVVVVHTHRTDPEPLIKAGMRIPSLTIHRCPDEEESGYPKSASHLFLRTLEIAGRLFPGYAILWCEADSVPMRTEWFAEISAEYDACGKPFLGARVGKKHVQMSGIGVYPPDWRKIAPKLADLNAPDISGYGKGKGCAWDVWAADQVVPNMAVSKRIYTVWKAREIFATPLKDIPADCALFHQDKQFALQREIAALRYPEFMNTLSQGRRFFFMNGHPSRVAAKGLRIKFSYHKFSAGFHRAAVCSDELTENDASALATLVGQLGIREMTEDEFLKLTGRQPKSLPPPRVRVVERPPSNHSHPQVFVMLGRYGDICNVLPMMKAEADAGRRPTLVVSKDFQDILDGVSYVDRIVWDGPYDQLPEALRWLRASKKIMAPVVAQVHRNPIDRARLCDSYQKEAWRLAGRLGDFATRGPLDFDNRNDEREAELVAKIRGEDTRPMILVGLNSHSSPFKGARAIMEAIQKKFTTSHNVVDLSQWKVARIYDLIAVFDVAACLVTTDTVFLHLARASSIGVVALLNDGWRGSVPHADVYPIRYAEATADRVVAATDSAAGLDVGALIKVCKAVKASREPKVFHVVDVFGDDPRHQVAQETWAATYDEGMVPIHLHEYARDAKTELGHKKALPFLKDILQAGLNESANDDDVVCWSNSDIGFAPGATEAIGTHVRQHGAASMRRTESNGEHHMGRDMFAFTAKWLKEWWSEIPDYVIGVPVFDLGLVAMIRLKHGIKVPITTKNVGADMPPADMPPGFILHQSHVSEWLELNHHTKAATKHNHDAFWNWCQKFSPATKFSKGHNLV